MQSRTFTDSCRTEGELMRNYECIIKRTARRFFMDHDLDGILFDAEDLEQEARIALLKRLRKNPSICYEYAKEITYGTSMDMVRNVLKWRVRKDRAKFLPMDDAGSLLAGNAYFPSCMLDCRIISSKVLGLIGGRKTFSDKRKAAFWLRYKEGWTQDEIAAHLHMAQGRVSRNLERALDYARAVLKA